IQAFAVPIELAAIKTTDDAGRLQRFDDLPGVPRQAQQQVSLERQRGVFHRQIQQRQIAQLHRAALSVTDRKSVGEGKSVSVRVDLGGGRLLKKKKKHKK